MPPISVMTALSRPARAICMNRTAQIYINFRNNSRLDAMNFRHLQWLFRRTSPIAYAGYARRRCGSPPGATRRPGRIKVLSTRSSDLEPPARCSVMRARVARMRRTCSACGWKRRRSGCRLANAGIAVLHGAPVLRRDVRAYIQTSWGPIKLVIVFVIVTRGHSPTQPTKLTHPNHHCAIYARRNAHPRTAPWAPHRQHTAVIRKPSGTALPPEPAGSHCAVAAQARHNHALDCAAVVLHAAVGDASALLLLLWRRCTSAGTAAESRVSYLCCGWLCAK